MKENFLGLIPTRPGELMANLSGAAFGLGFVGLIFFWFFFEVSGDGHTANLDLMNQRLAGILISLGMIILGGLFQICRQVALLRANK